MKNESAMRRVVVKALQPLDAMAVENVVRPGTPDVNYCEGWIELKHRKTWPRKAYDPVTLPHFTPQQRVWLRRRWRRGGHAYLLLWVDGFWLLFDGETAADYVGRESAGALQRLALLVSYQTLDKTKLLEILCAERKKAL